jgi:hypothetical protein
MTDSPPGTTKVVTFIVRRADTNALYDPPVVRAIFGSVAPDIDPKTTVTYGVEPEITKSSTGVYVVECVCPTAGVWGCQLQADSGFAVVGAFEQYWTIRASRLVP